MSDFTLATFKKRFPEFTNFCEQEGIGLVQFDVAGVYETKIIGFDNPQTPPWEVFPELQTMMENDDVLKHAMINRPLMKQRDVDGNFALATFNIGEMYSSANLNYDSLSSTLLKDYPTDNWGRSLGAEALGKLSVACTGIDWASRYKLGSTFGDKDDDFTVPMENARNTLFDVTDVAGVQEWVDEFGRLFGAHKRHKRRIMDDSGVITEEPGKIWLYKHDENNPSWSGVGNWWEGATTMSSLERVNHTTPTAAIAPDCRYAAVSFYIGGPGSNSPDSTNQLCKAYGAYPNVFTAIKQMSPSWYIELIVEIPLHTGPSDTEVFVSQDFFSAAFQKANPRYGSLNDSNANYNAKAAKQMYGGDIKVEINGTWRKLSEVPKSDHGSSVLNTNSRILPILGVPPKIHCGFVGVLSEEGILNCEVSMFKFSKSWLSEYLTGAFGRKLKTVNASVLTKEWPEDYPDQFAITNYAEGFTLTRSDIEATNVARRYKKLRENACKTDNFMQLDYIPGKTYASILDTVNRQGGCSAFGVYSTSSLVKAGVVKKTNTKVTVVKNTTKLTYDVTLPDGTKESAYYSGALATAETKAKALEYVGLAMSVAGVYPSTYASDLSVGADVKAELQKLTFEFANNGGRALQVVTTPTNQGGVTGKYHAAQSLSRNGFFFPEHMHAEQRVESILHSSAVTLKSVTSGNRIMNQFANSAYGSNI